MMKLSKQLRASKAVIDTPGKWNKGAFARDVEGNGVSYRSNRASSFCILGACWKGCGASVDSVQRVVDELISTLGGKPSLSEWNDDKNTTHADVMALFDRAIASAEARGE